MYLTCKGSSESKHLELKNDVYRLCLALQKNENKFLLTKKYYIYFLFTI
jgi:hypothetical protein